MIPEPPGCLDTDSRSCSDGSSPAPEPNRGTVHVDPVVGIGRYEGTHKFLGRREHTGYSLPSSFTRR
mgnify:CR=1 FL=1